MAGLPAVAGAILAGGRATRMNHQDKGLLMLSGKPLWEHIYRQLAPQVSEVIISANRNLEIYRHSGLQIIPDSLPDYPGPLAGILAVTEGSPQPWFFFCPCDTPHIPPDIVFRLWQWHPEAPVLWVHDGTRDHPTLALVNRRIAPALRDYLARGGRRVLEFFKGQGGLPVTVSEPVINLNTPQDWQRWQQKKAE